jgi:ABC-type uncharacterized transport system auxiliary subunit
MKRGIAMSATLLLGACIGAGSSDPIRYFVLDPERGTAATPYAGAPVIVEPTTAAGFYASTQIVYSDMPGVRARYRYSFWTERPQQVLQAQLRARLQGAGTGTAYRLDTRIDEIYHDASSTPGVVRITVTASLSDPAHDELVASRRFTRTAPAAAYDAHGAVAGMRTALAAVLDDIVGWVQANVRQRAQPGAAAPG